MFLQGVRCVLLWLVSRVTIVSKAGLGPAYFLVPFQFVSHLPA
jgi:hypothetical protein